MVVGGRKAGLRSCDCGRLLLVCTYIDFHVANMYLTGTMHMVVLRRTRGLGTRDGRRWRAETERRATREQGRRRANCSGVGPARETPRRRRQVSFSCPRHVVHTSTSSRTSQVESARRDAYCLGDQRTLRPRHGPSARGPLEHTRPAHAHLRRAQRAGAGSHLGQGSAISSSLYYFRECVDQDVSQMLCGGCSR
jgi:hypothetical protein